MEFSKTSSVYVWKQGTGERHKKLWRDEQSHGIRKSRLHHGGVLGMYLAMGGRKQKINDQVTLI